MMNDTKRQDFSKLVSTFSEVSARKYANRDGVPQYSYAAGYLESVLVGVYGELSEGTQQLLTRWIQENIDRFSSN